MSLLKPYTSLVLFFVSLVCVFAQKITLQDTLYCNYLGQEQGLLQLNIKGMVMDDLGYLWAGTEDGLHKFNSYDFKAYLHNPKDSTSIKDDHIRGLHFTNDTLWIATNTKGIIGFVPSRNAFFDLKTSNNIQELNTSYSVLKLTNNLLLFSIKNHVIIYNRLTKKSQLIVLPLNNKECYITDVLHKKGNTFWLGTSNSGIFYLDITANKITETSLLKDNRDLCFLKTDNEIYIGTKEGLYTYNPISKKTNKATLTLAVKCFYKINDDQFYLGTKSGLYRYTISSESLTPITCITQKNKSFKTFDINKIIDDKKGNLWIGTEADGLIHYNIYQKKFNAIKLALKEFPLKNNISSFQFLKGKDSTLWIGSKFGIVNYSHLTQNFKFYKNEGHPLIYTIIQDKKNNIWAGGFTTGLLKYNPKTDRFQKIETSKSKLPDNDVVEIIPIDDNQLWVCTWSGGIHKFNIKTQQFEELLINGKRLNRARTSLLDTKGTIWLGTDEGVYKISKTVERFQSNSKFHKKLSSDRIFSIKEDYSGNIWFGTNSGLTKLNPTTNKTTLYYNQKGLPNDFIYTVLISNDNNVWVSTNFGISVLNTKTNSFTNYTISDGLQNNEFNGKAAYKDKFGNFYFGGISGINIFNPKNIIENPYLPDTHIESIELFNKPLNKNVLYLDELAFKSDENVITFNFSGINYLNPEKCVYTYKMEGFDNTWRPITKNRSTTYTNLDPGSYTFKVKSSNDTGIWNEQADELKITIIPPWYQTTAFRTLAISSFFLIIFLFYIYKTSKLKKDKIKLEEIVTQRTNEIQLKNSDLEDAYVKADKQRNNIAFLMRELSHRVKNNLQIISSLLNIQANTIDDESSKNALKVAKNRILAISHIEDKIPKNNEDIKLDLFIKSISDSIIAALSDDESLKFKLEYDLEPNIILKNTNITLIGLILNELITNTTKYAFDKYKLENLLKISCHVNNSCVVITVKDNGIGYDLNSSINNKSLGLELVAEMVDQLNGTIQINSTKCTENIINIPF